MVSAPPIAASLLRRLDWRYLVPQPVPQPESSTFDRIVLLGADRDLVAAAVAIGLARQVTTTLRDDHQADLVAVLSPSRMDARRIMGALRPGGVVYVEVDRRRRGSRSLTAQRLANCLTEHGASINAQYALRPTAEACELFVPLDNSGALNWFLSNVYIASSPAKVFGEFVVRRLLGSNARRVGALAPFHATIAVSPPAPGPAPMGRVVDSARAADKPRSTAMIVHGGNRVVQFAFSDPTDVMPFLVAKMPKHQHFADRTRHEHEMVRRLRDSVDPVVRASVPKPREMIELGGAGLVAVEDVAKGYSLARSCCRWGRPLQTKVDDLFLATSWLIRLHRDNQIGDGLWDEERHAEAVDAPLAAFGSRFVVSDREAALFEAARAASRELLGTPLPIVWEHGDFSIWNVFRDGDRVRVLDWEYCRPGVPLTDMIRLVTHWHEAARGLSTQEMRHRGFVELFCDLDKRHGATTEARASIERYESALGIDPRFRSVLLVMSRVELAVRRHQQQRDDGIGDVDGLAGNAALGYLSSLLPFRASLFGHTTPAGSLHHPSGLLES
jgi:Phosphotransferase enzyme family